MLQATQQSPPRVFELVHKFPRIQRSCLVEHCSGREDVKIGAVLKELSAMRAGTGPKTMTTDGEEKARLRIMLVDDDALSLAVMALLLQAEGHTAMQAESGDAALRALATAENADAPDVLLVDIQMPGMSGSRLAAQLRKMVGRDAVLLAMSATQHELPEGYDDFLLKPLDVKNLELASARRRQTAKVRSRGDGSPVLDDGIYGNLRRAMPASSVNEVYAACVQDTRHRVPEMRAWAQAGEMGQVRRIAHAIKGGAGMVGAMQLAELASHLEFGSYREDELTQMLDEMIAMCDEVERILKVKKTL